MEVHKTRDEVTRELASQSWIVSRCIVRQGVVERRLNVQIHPNVAFDLLEEIAEHGFVQSIWLRTATPCKLP